MRSGVSEWGGPVYIPTSGHASGEMMPDLVDAGGKCVPNMEMTTNGRSSRWRSGFTIGRNGSGGHMDGCAIGRAGRGSKG